MHGETCHPRAVIRTFDHAVVAVRDLDRSADRMSRLLGRAASWRGVHPDFGTANALFRLDNGYLELLARQGTGPRGEAIAGVLEDRGEGLVALAFGSDDVDAFAQQLRARGVGVGEPSRGEGRPAEWVGSPGSQAVRAWSTLWLPATATRGLPLFAIQHHPPASSLPLRPPDGAANAAVVAFDHVVVISDDSGASREIYADLLGLRLALDRDFEQRGIRICFFRVGGVTIEVAGPREARADTGAADRFGGIAYRVPDVDAVRARLVADGFDVSDTRPGHKPGTRVCSVRDGSCGVPTLLIEAATRPDGRHRPGP
jgi:catechol 2,3-dioxygenase-like lactoylglutathione lyase family enzyme